MSELNKLGTQFDKVAKEARNLDQRLNGLYEDMGNILSRYYKIGEISEDEMKQRLGIKESKGDCGCGCGGVTEGGCGDKSVNEEAVKVSSRNADGSITTTIKEESEELLQALKDKLSDEGGAAGFKDLQDKAKEMGVELTADMLKDMDGISQHRDGDYILDGFASDAQRRAAFASGYKAKGKKGKKKIKEGMMKKIHMMAKRAKDSKDFVKMFRKDFGTQFVKTGKKADDMLVKMYKDTIGEINTLEEFGNKVTPLIEKNVPTNPSKWAYYKAQAKKKFDVYPSAYANGWAAKKYKAAGGGWKKG